MAPKKKYTPLTTNKDGSAYFSSIPHESEAFQSVNVREAHVVKAGALTGLVHTTGRVFNAAKEAWRSVKAWEPSDSAKYALDPADGVLYDEAALGDVFDDAPSPAVADSGNGGVQGAPVKLKKPRSKVSKRPHVVWKELHHETYLDEICRTKGRGDYQKILKCPDCKSRGDTDVEAGDPIYRCCSECFLDDLVCQDCCVNRHKKLPYHRIEKWTGTCFAPVSLKDLGLRLQLNHVSMACAVPIPCHSSMSIIHTNGIHDVSIDFCGCEHAELHHIQLLRRRIYPSSQRVIQTCATFELLDMLHKFSLTTKCGTYDFYRGLEKLTDCTGIETPPSKYRPLLRMVVQWRHLRMLEWSGCALDSDGVKTVKPGACAIVCPSCPLPGINLPPDWQKAPAESQFLYALFVCMDANFRLKNQIVSNYDQDPGLGTGMAYVLPRKEYEQYVRKRGGTDEISTCVGFQAIIQANSRFSQGLRYTGVGGIFCARSEMVLPQGIGNLQKGERYSNMDFIFASGIAHYLKLAVIVISYDIACQWFKNLYARMEDFWPAAINKVPDTIHLIPAVPKLHEPMHQQTDNHQQFSFNYIPGGGLTDGEAPERVWAIHNPLGNSTKTMGPGTRHDVIDDHLNWWNYLKYINMGATLMGKYCAAVADRNLQVEAHKGLTAALSQGVAKKWEEVCKEWDEDIYPKDVPNPYIVEVDENTEAEARNELAKNEENRVKRGGKVLHETSADAFVGMGISIEDAQRRLKRLAKETPASITARKESGLTEQRKNLRSRINTWGLLVPIYMPGLLQYQNDCAKQDGPSPEAEYPEDTKIWLPSHLPQDKRESICYPELPEIEHVLRNAQCFDALKTLRHNLRMKSRLVNYKQKSVRGQKESTRSRTVINRVHDKARTAGEKYRWSRSAKLRLVGNGEWEKTLRVLEDDDIRSFQDAERLKPKHGRKGTLEDAEVSEWVEVPQNATDEPGTERDRTKRDGTGQTRRKISWIWWMPRKPDGDDEHDALLMIEWAKSRARAARATEEVKLLKEEMRRVLEYLNWRSKWWLSQISRRTVMDKGLMEGLRAGAVKQSNHQLALSKKFKTMWQTPLADVDLASLITDDTEPRQDVPDGEEPDEDEQGDDAGQDYDQGIDKEGGDTSQDDMALE